MLLKWWFMYLVRVEYIVEERENAGYHDFLIFQQFL